MGAAHARVYNRIKGCELVGVSDTDPGKKTLAATHNTRFFADYKQLLKQELDAVSICTPTFNHGEIATDVLESDCNIIVEKPFTIESQEGNRILKETNDAGKLLAVGYVERFNPAINKLKENLDFSTIFSTLSLRFGPGGPRIKDIGVLLDLGSHEINTLDYLMDSQPEVLYCQVSYGSKNTFEDYAYISLKYNAIHSHIEVSWLPQYKQRLLWLYGNDRFYILNYAQQSLKSYRPPPKVQIENGNWQDALWISRNVEEEIPVAPEEPLKLELQCFLESIKRGEILKPLCDGRDAINVLEIVEKAIAVSKTISPTGN